MITVKHLYLNKAKQQHLCFEINGELHEYFILFLVTDFKDRSNYKAF